MTRFLALPVAALAGLLAAGPAPAAPTHHHLHQALHDLKGAVSELEGSKHNYGGHKEAAMKDLVHAAVQVEKCLAAAKDPYPRDFKPHPDLYKDYKDHAHLRHCEHAIDAAIKHLKESKGNFGGHKDNALAALHAAHAQVKKCLEHAK